MSCLLGLFRKVEGGAGRGCISSPFTPQQVIVPRHLRQGPVGDKIAGRSRADNIVEGPASWSVTENASRHHRSPGGRPQRVSAMPSACRKQRMRFSGANNERPLEEKREGCVACVFFRTVRVRRKYPLVRCASHAPRPDLRRIMLDP